ncbi:WD40/YVTN/BNR-like repeat-containing protein [Paenibacillus sp. 1P07SE]|uniref:WD40/YVTN/BNR-like repeat-containing protein n=1 Tax=Paenibacillus sp. 1P07SE TaxID=3132209 RepID=UPI0039A48A05
MRKRQTICSVMLLLLLTAVVTAGCMNSGAESGISSAAEGSASPPSPVSSGSGNPPPPPDKGEETVGTTPVSSSFSGTVTALRLIDEQSAWIGGEGWIARTDDGGASWSTQMEHGFTVDQLFALNGKLAWASLRNGDNQPLKLMHTADGGKSWVETGTVPQAGFFHFVSAKEGFSGNARTTNGGRTWSTIPVPGPIAGSPYFHDRDHGWAVMAQEEGSFDIIRTTDSGHSWHVVMSRDSDAPVNDALIRSAGKDDAWVQLVGDSGMSQTSYSLFHLGTDGKWLPVLAHDGAGSGPAPGYAIQEETGLPRGSGTSPGALYVVDPETAFMGGQCMACDDANTLGKTTDGGMTWTELDASWPGHGTQLLGALDDQHVWLITTDHSEPSALFVSVDGGRNWEQTYTFE